MNLLLDTHTLIWWLSNARLSEPAREAIGDPENTVYVSMASIWEIAIKKGIGKLEAPSDLQEQVGMHGFIPLPIDFAHAATAGSLPMIHKDPFDRMLVAQAQVERMTLITRDPRLTSYAITTLRS